MGYHGDEVGGLWLNSCNALPDTDPWYDGNYGDDTEALTTLNRNVLNTLLFNISTVAS